VEDGAANAPRSSQCEQPMRQGAANASSQCAKEQPMRAANAPMEQPMRQDEMEKLREEGWSS
jgi:hypothetical protein